MLEKEGYGFEDSMETAVKKAVRLAMESKLSALESEGAAEGRS